MNINVFLVDDHPIVRDGLKAILQTQDDFKVIGEAGNGQEALTAMRDLEVDVLLTDLAMPIMDGLALIEALKAANSSIKTIVFTVFDTDERIMRAIKIGAKGYLLKGAAHHEIFEAIRVVHSGGSLLQPLVAAKLMQHISEEVEKPTLRELEVLQWLAKGKKNSEIAEALFISERTVKFHVSAILSKLNAQNRTEAVQIAIKRGMIEY